MGNSARACIAAGVWLAAAACPGTALAQDAADPPAAIQISANSALVSDYRFRGLSLSNRNPAIQGGIDLSHESGLFVGTWASSIASSGGSTVELDLYGGYGATLAGVSYSIQVLGYVYPGGSGVDYVELSGTASKTLGPVTGQVQLAYIPSQTNAPADNVYAALRFDVAVPSTPLTLRLRGGRETSSVMKKWDWETGVYYSRGRFTASLSYVDSDYDGAAEAGRNGAAGIVAALTATF